VRRRRPLPPEPRHCMTSGCGAAIPHWKKLCDGCWGRLPWPRRKAIIEAREAKAPHLVHSLSEAAAIWLKDNSPAAAAARVTGERE
jgi:hypothetical protein